MIAAFGPSEYLLRMSHHTTSFAGYHRAKDDVLWTIRWLTATPDKAKAMLNAVGKSVRNHPYEL
jgi:hypothetical protein